MTELGSKIPTKQNIYIASMFPAAFVFIELSMLYHYSLLFLVLIIINSVIAWWLCVLFLVTLFDVKLIGGE